jgi:hypothetical protein
LPILTVHSLWQLGCCFSQQSFEGPSLVRFDSIRIANSLSLHESMGTQATMAIPIFMILLVMLLIELFLFCSITFVLLYECLFFALFTVLNKLKPITFVTLGQRGPVVLDAQRPFRGFFYHTSFQRF